MEKFIQHKNGRKTKVLSKLDEQLIRERSAYTSLPELARLTKTTAHMVHKFIKQEKLELKGVRPNKYCSIEPVSLDDMIIRGFHDEPAKELKSRENRIYRNDPPYEFSKPKFSLLE